MSGSPRFGRPRLGRMGYARRDVDAFVQRLTRGVVAVREVETVRFVNRRWRAYGVDEVDAYLDAEVERLRLERPVPHAGTASRVSGALRSLQPLGVRHVASSIVSDLGRGRARTSTTLRYRP